MVKVPKLKLPKLVTTRESGEKAFLDLTLTEWGISLLVIVALYVLVVGYFIALLEISKVIRNSGNTYHIPGSRHFGGGIPRNLGDTFINSTSV